MQPNRQTTEKKQLPVKDEKVDQEIDFMLYTFGLEKQWKKSLPKFFNKELLNIFPEVKQIIPVKIREFQRQKYRLERYIKQRLISLQQKTTDDFSYWFIKKWLELNEIAELVKIDKQIARLNRLKFSHIKTNKNFITDDDIQQASQISIVDVVSQEIQLKRSSKNFVGLCPFHNEKTPSFYLYPETNSFYCYGCNLGGNIINFVMQFYGYSFIETIKWLLGK